MKIKIGDKYHIKTPQGLYVEVEVISYVPSFGRNRYKVKPTSGTKTAIVEKLFNIKSKQI